MRVEVQTGLSGSKIEKYKLTPTSEKLWITSLNLHFPQQTPHRKMLRVVKVGALEEVELSSPTQRRYRVLSQCDEDRLNRQTD